MSDKIKPLVAGNWKMNGLQSAVSELQKLIGLVSKDDAARCDVAICPPATLVFSAAQAAKGSAIAIGAQDCHPNSAGAHTGDISAEMLKDAGASYVITGHSERRADHGETDADVAAKSMAVLNVGLTPIICVGETEAQRRAGEAVAVVTEQLNGSIPADIKGKRIVIAYEPVWAIGTGLTPTLDDIVEIHSAIRANLVKCLGTSGNAIAILYGGSMKPANAAEIMALANVNGGLVGGASLKADDFIGVIRGA